MNFAVFFYSDKTRTPQSVIERADKLLDYFIPLIAKQDKSGNLQRLSLKEAAENMRNVVVVTHCYGSRLIEAVDKKIDEIMKDIGYQDKEIEQIHRQLFVMHQNTPVENLGVDEFHSTNLYRITKADENSVIEKYPLDSFPYYLQTEEMEKDEVLLSPISQNQQALIVAQISDKGESEHNGAYWVSTYLKTAAGKKEQQIAQAILKEVVFSDYPIININQIISKTIQQNPDIAPMLRQIQEYGKELTDDYHGYVNDIKTEHKQTEYKLYTHSLTEKDVEQLSVEALFITDDKYQNLFEKAIKIGDYKAAGILWRSMKNAMPVIQPETDIKTSFKGESYDLLEAFMVHHHYAQKAIEEDNIELFKEIVLPSDVYDLDIAQAKGETAHLIKSMVSKKTTLKKKNLELDDPILSYMQSRKNYLK